MSPIRIWPLAGCWLLVCASVCAHAQAGPPFKTDDPETPGAGRWEINVGFFGYRNPQGGAYSAPDLDINYGVGPRLQLKYELPLAVAESRPQPQVAATPAEPGSVLAGMGNSLLGVKYRFYERRGRQDPEAIKRGTSPDPAIVFGVSTYPQLTLSNPTRSVARSVVSAGPDLLLPVEVNARLGPIRVDAEVGYHFGNTTLAQSWIRGLLIGHEFSDRFEAYVELYDQQDANRVFSLPDGGGTPIRQPKQRQATVDVGGRYGLNRDKSLILLLMGGRSIQSTSSANSQPSWLAYFGLQFQLGKR